jgi:hypothetical protein
MVLSRHADREAEKALDGVYRGEDGWNQGACGFMVAPSGRSRE